MSRESLLIVIGVLVLVSPFLGLPGSVLAVIHAALGALTLSIGIWLRRERPQAHEASPSLVP